MRCLVTGGGGFLGAAIVGLLRERGDEVVSYSRSRHDSVLRLGGRCVEGDITDVDGLARAMEGAEVVFHTAAKAGVWGPRAEYERVNVLGTTAAVAAARKAGVPRFVHTSSPSVCFDGEDHEGASNDRPYPARYLAHYPRTKALAEKLVLASNGRGLASVALRPHLMVGPGDPHLMPRIADRARAGKLRIVGDGRNRVSPTDVLNAAWSHLDAADRLALDAPHAGRAYFIAQQEPVAIWPWIAEVLARAGLPGPRSRIPLGLALAAGAACETWWAVARKSGEPPMTRFVALQLARSHTYDGRPARHDFGYVERVSNDAMTERAVASIAAAR